MARRNVDLVISAKDEAEKVLRQITAALEEFSNASKGVSGSAEKTESSLGQLGAAISGLQKNLGGLDIAGKLDKELRGAGKELSRLDQKFEETQAEAAQLQSRFDSTAAAAARFAAKLAGAKAALDRQTSAVAKAKADQKELSAAYAQAEQAQAKLTARQAQLPALIERQSVALDKAKARYSELADQIERTEQPSRTLQSQFESSARSVAEKVASLNRLTTEYGEIGGQIRVAGSAMAIFSGQVDKAAGNLIRQTTALDKIKTNIQGLDARTKAAAGEQSRLGRNLADVTGQLDRQTAAINKAEANYVDLAQSAGLADAALEKLSAQSLGRLAEELKQQRMAALLAKREYTEMTATVGKLAVQMRQVEAPTQEMNEAFDRAKVKAAAAKQEYLEQRVALELMGRAYRDTGNDIASINATQTRFQTILGNSSNRLREISTSASRANAELDKLGAAGSRAAGGMERTSRAAASAAAANERAATATGRMAAAYREFYGDTRRSLSLLQRIRGEVLSLVAAYGGLYGAIEVLRGTVDAYQTLEAAQARLSVAVGGDQDLAAQELDFVRRTADRLGISFGVLSQEYSKFAIATKETRLEGEATRKIFLAVAEAARVNRSSTSEMAGVLTALTQIVSKGAVQMEELRQQLGDRLPGAIRIMADGLGVTTERLIEMMEAGEVTSDALLPFADELTRRFGPGLAESLKSTSTAIGRLGNEAFEALLRFGEAGFLEAFTDLAVTITDTLKSADFQAFSDNASAAMAKLVNFIGFAIENFRVLAAVITAFIGLRLTPIVLALAGMFGDFAREVKMAGAALAVTGAQAQGATGRMAALGAAVGRLRVALIGLLSTTGIGLLVAAVGAGIALWATEADNATEALVEHEAIVDKVKNTYDAVGGSVAKFSEEIVKSLKVTDARRNLRELQEALKDSIAAFNTIEDQQGGSFATRFFGKNLGRGASKELVAEIDKLIKAANDGGISMLDLADRIDEVAESYVDGDEATRRYLEGLVSAAGQIRNNAEAVRRAELVIKVLTGTVEEQEAALRELNGTVKESAATQQTAAEKAAAFDAALKSIQETIPQVKNELELLGKSEALNKMLLTAIQTAQSWNDVAEAMAAAGRAQTQLDNDFVGGSLVDRIIGVESGGDPNAKNPLSSATGLGQFIESTWLRMFKQYFPAQASGMTDAAILELRKDAATSRTMVQYYLQENAKHLRKAGVAINDANLYLSHFLGPGGATKLLSSAPGTVANDVLGADQIAANRGILDGKTREQVIAWAQRKVGISETELSIAEDVVDAQRKQAEEAQKQAERAAEERDKQRQGTAERIEDGNFEIEQQKLINAGLERKAAVEAAIRQAKAEDPNISEEELALIKQQTEALFDLEQQKKNATTASEKAKEAEQEVNNLLAQRAALADQVKLATDQGNTEQAENLRLKIGEVNAELLAAIANAQAMWQAVGGSEAEAAIQKLEAAKIETQNFGFEASKTYLQWDRVADLFVTGLASAFDTFAQKVAEGESAGEAARQAFLKFASDFLIQIAQMIIQQAIFNALKAAFGGTPFGNLIGVGTAHTGGLIGSSRAGSGNSTRKVSPAMFAAAPRYHTGGVIGLKPGEVPIIAKQGEEMLTRDDPRHMLNGGGKGGNAAAQKAMTIINTFDPAEAVERALATPRGEEVLVNAVRSARTEVKAALG